MKLLIIPQAWLDTLSYVRSVLPSAYLAGGALRDLDNDRPVKDLDVFFTEEAYSTADLDDGLAKMGYFYKSRCNAAYLAGAAGEVDGTTVYAYRDHADAVGTRTTHVDNYPELNLIQLDNAFNPAGIVDRVDFGLCQIGYGIMGLDTTPSYQFDKANQCLTLTRADSVEGVMRSIKRYERLSQKYHGWPFNVPDEFKPMFYEAFKRLQGDRQTFLTTETF